MVLNWNKLLYWKQISDFDSSLLHSTAAQFIKQKLPDLLRSYIDADVSGNQEGGFQDIAIEVLHLLLSHLLFGQKGAFGVGQEQIDAFLKTLRRGKCGVFLGARLSANLEMGICKPAVSTGCWNGGGAEVELSNFS